MLTKKKKKMHFHPLINLRLTPIFLSGHKSGKMHKCKGPLVCPNKVTVYSATVNNSKNVASAKVNIFYSDIPVPGGAPCVLVLRDIWHTCSPWRAAMPQRGAPTLALQSVWMHLL